MSSVRGSGISASVAKPICIGELHLMKSDSNESLAIRRIYVGHDVTIGRDQSRCQWVLIDPYLSAKHLRIYTIVYDNEEEHEFEHLVYAEDLSRHGTFWNDSLIGKGNGGVLLSRDDKLRLSCQTTIRFIIPEPSAQPNHFDLRQEREMAKFRREYVLTDRLLGSGAFGKVFMAIEQNTRSQVACKLIDLRKFSHSTSRHFRGSKTPVQAFRVEQTLKSGEIKQWADHQRKGSELEGKLKVYYREVDILSQLCHPNIVGIEKVFVTDNSIYIFQDLITAGDLFSYLESKNGKLLEVEAAVIIRQLLLALQFLHGQNIVHRDLKPENIMMTSLSAGCRVVLTDFGAARRVRSSTRMASVVGSEQYAAPELSKLKTKDGNKTNGYTKAVDMWSVGAITMVLLTGGSAFSDPASGSYSPVLARNADLDSLKRSKEWRQIRLRPQDFVTKLLVLDEECRMTAHQALSHAWFSNEMHRTDFEELYQRTIKNWRPRMAKNPVVEFVGSTFIRHLVPSQFTIENRMRSRGERTPVEPPYKPFPRNMHTSLWPKKKPIRREMSEEVRTAIANLWSGKIRRVEMRFKTYPQLGEQVESKISEQSRSSFERLSASVVPIHGSFQDHIATLPLRLVSDMPPQLTSLHPPPQTDKSFHKDLLGITAGAITARSTSNNTKAKNTSLVSVWSSRHPGNSRRIVHGLSRSSTSASAMLTIRKRPRSSMLELTDDFGSDSNTLNSEDTCENANKRIRVYGEEQTIQDDCDGLVVAHSPRASIDEDFTE